MSEYGSFSSQQDCTQHETSQSHASTSLAQSSDREDSEAEHASIFQERYQFIKQLDDGRFGRVLECRDRRSLRLVALKEPKSESKEAMWEAALLADMPAHPNVARLLDIRMHGKCEVLVMPLAVGGSLSGWIKAGGPFFCSSAKRTLARVLDAGMQIARGLCHIHLNKMVHADLKPGNMLALQVLPSMLRICNLLS